MMVETKLSRSASRELIIWGMFLTVASWVFERDKYKLIISLFYTFIFSFSLLALIYLFVFSDIYDIFKVNVEQLVILISLPAEQIFCSEFWLKLSWYVFILQQSRIYEEHLNLKGNKQVIQNRIWKHWEMCIKVMINIK
jgi:hypothetical protein